jgi:hypothetical protein
MPERREERLEGGTPSIALERVRTVLITKGLMCAHCAKECVSDRNQRG